MDYNFPTPSHHSLFQAPSGRSFGSTSEMEQRFIDDSSLFSHGRRTIAVCPWIVQRLLQFPIGYRLSMAVESIIRRIVELVSARLFSEFNFYLMPLSFVRLPTRPEALLLNPEEKHFSDSLRVWK